MTPQRKKWYLIWTLWLLMLVVTFAILEALSWNSGVTLSRYVWDLSMAWPLIIWIAGALAGGLAVHFWWHWEPPGSESEG